MNEKYLPIGSIITTKKNSQKIMIIGYFGLEYNDTIEVYDYIGCNYPEGLLEKNNISYFNHEDIITCDFVGYKDLAFTNLNKKLIGEDAEDNNVENLLDEEMLEPLPKNIVFDDELLKIIEDDQKDTSSKTTNNSIFEELPTSSNKSETKEEVKKHDNEEFKIPHYHFDENGIIITEEDN